MALLKGVLFLEEVTNYFDSGYPVDVIYLDFHKAFDKFLHGRLVSKLEAHGIGGEILKWVVNWLSERKQRVVLGGEFSEWRYFILSVSHRDLFWGLFFSLYIPYI